MPVGEKSNILRQTVDCKKPFAYSGGDKFLNAASTLNFSFTAL